MIRSFERSHVDPSIDHEWPWTLRGSFFVSLEFLFLLLIVQECRAECDAECVLRGARLLKLPNFKVQKNWVQFCKKSIGAAKYCLATSYDDLQRC